VSDELVERLAVVICESDTVQPMGWEDVTAHWQDNYRTQARAVLDALTRRIETVAQLDALPDRTVVRSREEVMGDPVERAAEALERFRVVDLTSAFARGNVAKAVVDALGLTKEAK